MGANVAFPNLESPSVREERARIARELHDTLLQTFLSALLQLGVAVDTLPSDSPVKSKLSPILGLIEQGMEEGRNAIQGLRSPGAGALDLVVALSEVRQPFLNISVWISIETSSDTKGAAAETPKSVRFTFVAAPMPRVCFLDIG